MSRSPRLKSKMIDKNSLRVDKVEQKKRTYTHESTTRTTEPNISVDKNRLPENKCLKAGDPINVTTGSFYVEATDLVLEDRGTQIEIKRRYNSVEKGSGSMGKNWFFEFESHIKRDGEEAEIIYPDGHTRKYAKVDSHWKDKDVEDEAEVLSEDAETGGYVLTIKQKNIYRYDKSGKLASISDRNGNSTQVVHNYNGEIDSIISPGRKMITFKYKSGKIAEISDNIGRKIIYQHEGDNLTEVTYPNGGKIKYAYQEPCLESSKVQYPESWISSITDQNGITYVRNEYDKKGRVIKQHDNEGNLTEIEYDDEKMENTFTYHATGVIEKYRYNKSSLLTERVYSDGTSEKYTYDSYLNRNSETDRNGRTIQRKYDNKGNLLREIYPGGYTVEHNYDNDGNLTETITSGGAQTLCNYDDKGNLLEEHVKIEKDLYAITKYSYDDHGRVLSRTDPENNTTLFEYEENHIAKPTKVKDPEGNIFSYAYDKAGRMLSISTSYGKVSFTYNPINKKLSVVDAKGNVTKMEYDMMGNLVRKTLPNGMDSNDANNTNNANNANNTHNTHNIHNAYTYSYDSMDRLIKTVDPMKNIFLLQYDIHGNLTKEINPNHADSETYTVSANKQAGDKVTDSEGTGVEYIYDESRRKIKTLYPTGGETRITYDPAGNIIKTEGPTKENDKTNRSTQYEYDEMNRLIKIKDPSGNTKEYVYDRESRIIKEINAKGHATLYKYNDAGWILEKRIPVEEKIEMILYSITQYSYDLAGRKTEERISPEYADEISSPRKWNTIKYTYDKNSRIIKITDATGAQIQYTYDCLGNRTLEKIKINDDKTKTIRYRYDSLGRLEKKSEEIDGDDLADKVEGKAIAQTVYEYDANGNIIKITAPKGYETTLCYDKSDRIVKVIKSNGKENPRITQYQHDKAGNVIKETDCNGNSIKYDYDSMNRQIRITDKEGGITRLFYDEAGNIIKHVTPRNYDPQKDDGIGTTYKYDGLNRIIEIKDALGAIVQQNKYNSTGELIEKTDALQKGIEYKYDIGGRIKEILTPGANKKGIAAQQYNYDALGNITGIQDGEGNRTTHTLDLWGRITGITKADGSVEQYTYDCAGNITSSTDGNGNTTQYTYNSLNLLSQITDPTGKLTTYRYDVQGRVARKIDRKRNVTEYLYNIDDNLVMRKDIATNFKEEFIYNLDGTLKTAASGNTVYRYDYTPGLKLKAKKADGNPLLNYTYDKDGNIAELKDITGRLTQYKYDPLGRMEEVWDGNRKEATYTYNPDGTPATINFGNQIKVEYTYDEDKNLTGILTKNNEDMVILNHKYVYDNNGNQIEKDENGEVTHYIYDKLNRLSKAVYPNIEEAFEYDRAGNRTKRIYGNTSTTYSYDRRNQLSEKVEGGMQTSYDYDPQGNLIAESRMYATTKYTYDCFNRTNGVQSADGGFVENRYDPEGLRCAIYENGYLSRFIFSGRDIVAELDENYNLKTATIRGHEILAQKDTKGDSYYYLNNAHGDVTALINSTGDIVNSYKYDAFGNTIESVENVQNRFRYAGEQFDPVTGQYYLRARFYNPVVGRFTQEDTYRGDGLNLYSYVQNNPIKYIDPSGYSCESKNNVYTGAGQVKGASAVVKEVKPYDITTYRPTNSPLENHHGVMDAWAAENVPGYVSRAPGSPAMALTKEAHNATRSEFMKWKYETYGSTTAKVDWKNVSPQQIQGLSDRMFNAAKAPTDAVSDYYRAFNQYIYNLK